MQSHDSNNQLTFALAMLLLVVVACACPNTNDNRQYSNSNASNTNVSPVSNTHTTSTNTNQTTVIDPERDGLKLIASRWEKGGFGTIAMWRITIQNVSDKPLGDIKFRTAYFSETRNKVGQGGVDGLIGKDTIEKVVPPKSKRTFEVNDGFVSDEADTASFELVSWRIVP